MPTHRPTRAAARARGLAAVLACLVFCATGSAAIRFASPTGAGVSPCAVSTPATAACPVTTAVNQAMPGDVVHLLAGNYTTTASLFASAGATGLTVEGEGATTTVVNYAPTAPTSNAAFILTEPTWTLRGLTVTGNGNVQRLVSAAGTGGTLDRVQLRNAGTGDALAAGSVTIRDSVITATPNATFIYAAHVGGTITGSTIVADNAPTSRALLVNGSGTTANLVVRNTILRGGSKDVDIVAASPSTSSTLDIDSSAYRAGGITCCTNTNEVLSEGPHNVFASPLLVTFAGGADVHQLPGSPTIDAGDPAAATGSTGDMDGQLRTIGSAPDIGADEALTKPAVALGAATNVTTTGATLSGTVNPAGTQTTYRFEYGPTVAYGSASADVVVPAGFVTAAVTLDVSGFAPGATIHARLVATNSAGTAASADQAITLVSPPPPTPPPPPSTPPTDDPLLLVGPLALTPLSPKSGRVATVRFSLSEQARVTLTIDRLLPGRRKGTACRVGRSTGARCTKAMRRATLTRTLAAGAAATFSIPARIGGTKLVPGRYRVSVTARDLVTGKDSPLRSVTVVVRA